MSVEIVVKCISIETICKKDDSWHYQSQTRDGRKLNHRSNENCDIDAVANSSSLLVFLISAALLIMSCDGSLCRVLVVVRGPYN